MEPVSNGEEPASWDELYNINLMPSELFLKFRKEVQGIRVGLNMEVSFDSTISYQFSVLLSIHNLLIILFSFNLTLFVFLSNICTLLSCLLHM